MVTKIRLLLARADGATDAAIEDALRAEAGRLDRALPGKLTHRFAVQLADEQLREAAKGGCYTGGPPFGAMMEAALAEGTDVQAVAVALEGFADRFAKLIQPGRSAVAVGAVEEILSGAGPIHIAIGARRLPHLTHQGYIDYWFGNHSDEARSTDTTVGGMGYNQFHADLAATEMAARRAGLAIHDFDGVAETYFADREALERVYGAPGIWESAFADEQRFVDHKRSVFSLFLMVEG